MWASFFTKPLQGSTFKKMQNIILNLPNTDKANAEHRGVLENERKNKKEMNTKSKN